MTTIEKIKAEVERRKNICEGIFERESDTYYQGKAVAYGELLPFLSDLEKSEKPMNQEVLEEEIEKEYTKLPPVLDLAKFEDYTIIKAFASHFYELGCRRTAEKYETI